MAFFLKEESYNTKQIFSLVQKTGLITKQEMVEKSGLPLTSLNRALKPLIKNKYINKIGIAESSGGRKPSVYDVNTTSFFIIGIDISRTYVNIVITNFKMELIFKAHFFMNEESTPLKIIEEIYDRIQSFTEQHNIKYTQFIGIGLGIVGPMDRKKGILLSPKYFPAYGWDTFPIVDALKSKFNLPVIMDNGANTAVFAEYMYGCGNRLGNISYFNLGMGIRTGNISDGNLIRTDQDVEDSFAHMIVDLNGRKCICNSRGCINAYSTIPAIELSYKEQDCYKSYIDIFKEGESQKDVACKIIKEAAHVFGVGLANYSNLFNPKKIILSGPIITYSSLFYKEATYWANKIHGYTQKSKIEFYSHGFFGENAIAIGAAAITLEKAIK